VLQPLSLFAWLNSEWSRRFPRHRMVGAAASVIFWIPILREVFLYSGCALGYTVGGGLGDRLIALARHCVRYRDASRGVLARALKEGNSVYLCTGGEEESLETVQGIYLCVTHSTPRLSSMQNSLSIRS
jgi:hypothetical protein